MTNSHVRGYLRERVGSELVERIEHLDAVRRPGGRRVDAAVPAPDPSARVDYDVVFAGGGLSLVIAAQLARLGVRVAVADRARAAAAHREWNASEAELDVLVGSGLLESHELDAIVVAAYDQGFCRFGGGRPHVVRGVLDRAVDAGALLTILRNRAMARGVDFLDGFALTGWGAGDQSVCCRFDASDGAGTVVARFLVDARGASSPSCTADLICPTVGGVLEGLRAGDGPLDINPKIGEILVTTEGVEEGRQHVWEGFPGSGQRTTVYLFYYASSARAGTLMDLYARFFERLSSYKQGDAKLIRPTFGYIPGWSRLGPPPRAPHRRVVLVGDAAARQSPLTFCGFGAMLRSFVPAAEQIARAVAGAEIPESVVDDRAVHGWTGPLAALMASGKLTGNEINELLDTAFGVLSEMGNEAYAALLQDRMVASEFLRFVRKTSQIRRRVYRDVAAGLGVGGAGRWGWNLLRGAIAG